MTFIETVPEDRATRATAELHATDQATFGYLPNFTRAFSSRPAVYAAWRQLNGAIKSGMDLRRYALVSSRTQGTPTLILTCELCSPLAVTSRNADRRNRVASLSQR
jgi:hypothetical protein